MQISIHSAFNCKGAAAVEFAIVVTVLVSLVLGVADLVPALLVKLKSNHATTAAADLTTQSQLLQASDIADIYAGASDVLAPFSSVLLISRITSVYSDGAGHAYVHWSCGQGVLPAYAARMAVTATPSGDSVDTVLNRNAVTYNGTTYSTINTTYIVVETRYTYTAPTQYVLKNAFTLTNVAYALPRLSSYVGFPWDGVAGDTTTAPASATHNASVTLTNGATCNYIY